MMIAMHNEICGSRNMPEKRMSVIKEDRSQEQETVPESRTTRR